MFRTFAVLWRDESGLTAVEYALLLAMIVVAGIAAWRPLMGAAVPDHVSKALLGR